MAQAVRNRGSGSNERRGGGTNIFEILEKIGYCLTFAIGKDGLVKAFAGFAS